MLQGCKSSLINGCDEDMQASATSRSRFGESSQHGGVGIAKRKLGFKDFFFDNSHKALEEHGIHLHFYIPGHCHRHGGSGHLCYLEDDKKYQRVP